MSKMGNVLIWKVFFFFFFFFFKSGVIPAALIWKIKKNDFMKKKHFVGNFEILKNLKIDSDNFLF